MLPIPVKIPPPSLRKGNNSLKDTFGFLFPSVYIYRNHFSPKTNLFIPLKYDCMVSYDFKGDSSRWVFLLSRLQAPFKELLVFPNPPTKFISSCLQPRVKLN